MPTPNGSIPLVLLANFLTQAVGYFAVVGTVFFIVWHRGRERFHASRIPAPNKFGREQLRREIGHTLVTFIAGTASAGTIVALHAAGLARLSTAPVSPLVVGAWVLGALAFNDAWFYAWHRLFHHPLLFRHIHSVHHKSVDVNPFTSYSFHAVEAVVLGLWIVPAALLLPIPMTALTVLQAVGLANNVMSHLGYELMPRWILRVPLLRWTNTATFHSLHHTRLRGNFGLHTRLWDRLFGTEVPEYEQVFLARSSATASAPAMADAG